MAFDVKVEKDAQELADTLHVKIFQADIIYHLFDKFIAYQDELKAKKRDEFKSIAVFPCKLKVSTNNDHVLTIAHFYHSITRISLRLKGRQKLLDTFLSNILDQSCLPLDT